MYTNEIFKNLIGAFKDSNLDLGKASNMGKIELLYCQLKSDVLCAKFAADERLIEEKLAERYQLTSRTPIREVLAQLKSEGHVKLRGRSLVTQTYKPETLLQLYDVRLTLEMLAVRKAIECKKNVDLRSYLQNIQDAQNNEDPIAVNAADGLFHLKIAEMSENSILIDHLSRIHEKVFYIRNTFFKAETQEKNLVTAHELLLTAIERGAIEVAAAEMSHHLNDSRHKFESQLKQCDHPTFCDLLNGS